MEFYGETEYSQLLAQVRSQEFDKEIHDRLEKEKALLEEKSKNDLQTQVSAKDKEIGGGQNHPLPLGAQRAWRLGQHLHLADSLQEAHILVKARAQHHGRHRAITIEHAVAGGSFLS